ncbi:germination protein YpeB [Bacillus sp. MUM 13]|uniref:germination protein YpeB n=1 Tax=Bacillus sp. MUM 13 TaxID=1678001 RepID=UPI0008F57372|nr:germination protein YpeB [Bacillus sp. MUM 13]OIK12272.1 germination protein YpeB [Bacillus sp. MUM 13]
MIKNIGIAVLAAALIVVSVWGYKEHKEKTAVLIHAENTYQRAFHDLAYQVDTLHDKIGNTLAMNSRKSLSPALTDVWRLTSEAQNDVGQLPLSLMAFNKTEEFLSKIGDFTYRTSVRDLEKEPLNDKEYANLKTLYTQAGEIQDELRKTQYLVLKNHLKWMDVETALASGEAKSDNTILDGLKIVEKKVSGYSESDTQNPTNVSMEKQNENYSNLKGKEITKKEAVSEARKYANFSKSAKVSAESNGKGANYGFYSITLTDPATKDEANMDIAKKGGYPIWMINTRKVNEEKLGLNQAEMKAKQFLKSHQFNSLDLYESSQYDHIGLFNFVGSVGGVRIYPDSVKVKIALDDGSVIGFSAEEFLKSNKMRKIGTAKLSLEQARTKINPKVKVMEERKALIINDVDQEVLCYEFLGTIGEDTYRIFINGNTGQEEKVEKLKNAERMYDKFL